MEMFGLLFLFIFGLLVGSFLNVLIDRLPSGENPWYGRSRCDHCQKTLAARDLVPLLSFVTLRGKSRCCHKPLDWRMPLVEFLTGLLFAFTFFYITNSNEFLIESSSNFISLAGLLTIFCSFLAIFFIDVKHQIIPDAMVVTTIIGSLLYHLNRLSNISIYQYITTGIGAAVFLGLVFLATRGRGMGLGDVKLAFALGLFMGWPQILVAIYLAFLTGAVVSLILVLARRKKLKSRIAFGPFLIAGTVMSFFYGEGLLRWINTFL